MTDVVLKLATKDFVIPPDSTLTDGPFTYAISGPNYSGSKSDSAATVTFSSVPPGDYTATATKLGVSASATFTVPEPAPTGTTVQVPDALTVVLQ